jgi:heme exporter protein D
MMPENTFYYQLAYGVTIAFYVAYALSLVVRRRSLARRRERAAGRAP